MTNPIHRQRDERGFTLIELMVVVLIIGILLAIAIPTFLGARTRGQDSVAKTSLRNGLTAADVLFTDSQDFSSADQKAMSSAEGGLDYTDGGSSSNGPKQLSITANSDDWTAAARSESGTCFYIHTTSQGTVTYQSDSSAKECRADDGAECEQLAMVSRRRVRSQAGFTLIELMVVVLIIGILLAIAIPTFLGARSRGQDSVAKSSLSLAVKSVLAEVLSGGFDGGGGNSSGDLGTDLKNQVESSLDWTQKDSSGPKEVSVDFGDGYGGFAARSESGTCFYVYGTDSDGDSNIKLTYGQADNTSCNATEAKDYAGKSQF